MKFIIHEFLEIALRPTLWIGALLVAVLLVYATGRIQLEEEDVHVVIYQGDLSTPRDEHIDEVGSLAREIAGIKVAGPKRLTTDLATAMTDDKADIAIMPQAEGWRLTVRSRSSLEHRRLVRFAQLLGASINRREPWFVIVYKRIYEDRSSFDSLCMRADRLCSEIQNGDLHNQRLIDVRRELCSAVEKVKQSISESCIVHQATPGDEIQISGLAADPGSHARLYVPRVIALLVSFLAFAFACRSMLRDISNNTLPVLLASSGNSWFTLALAKVIASVILAVLIFLVLIAFAALDQDFHIKAGLGNVLAMQTTALTTSAMLGVVVASLGRSEARIYLIGSIYLIVLLLLSGFIAKVDEKIWVLRAISHALPLRFVMDPLESWMTFGVKPSLGSYEFHIIAAQSVAGFAVLNVALERLRRLQ